VRNYIPKAIIREGMRFTYEWRQKPRSPDEKYGMPLNDRRCSVLHDLLESSDAGTAEFDSSGVSSKIIPLA